MADEVNVQDLPSLVRFFLFDQLLADDIHTSDNVLLSACPRFEGRIKIFNSATAIFFTPSDPCGIGGMRREQIRSAPSWRKGPGRYDTVFINTQSEDGINGMEIGRVLCFFSFYHSGENFPCALIHWFKVVGNEPDASTGMWMVRPSFYENGAREASVIHVDTIIRAAHLLPIFGAEFIPETLTFHDTLDSFRSFYVNRFVDHHAFEIAS